MPGQRRPAKYLRFLAAAVLLPLAVLAATPEQFRERVGVYAWGQLRKSDDPLVASAADVKSLGSRVFRTTISPYWDPRGIEDLRPLDEKVKRADYQAAFREFPVVMITAYDAASYYARYRSPEVYADKAKWAAMLKDVEAEFYRFAYELSQAAGVRFIISNWEAENDAPDAVWPQYLEYMQARLNGTIRGRDAARADGHPGQVYTAFEFRYIKPGAADPWAKTPPRKYAGLGAAVHDLSGVEYLSYSSWSSISHSEKFGYNQRQLEAAFADMRSACQANSHPCRIIIGETGYLWDHDPDNRNFAAILNTCLDAGAEFVLNWCAYDQPGQSDPYGFKTDLSHWGKFTLEGALTPQGRALKRMYEAPFTAPLPRKRPARTPVKRPGRVAAPLQ